MKKQSLFKKKGNIENREHFIYVINVYVYIYM